MIYWYLPYFGFGGGLSLGTTWIKDDGKISLKSECCTQKDKYVLSTENQ